MRIDLRHLMPAAGMPLVTATAVASTAGSGPLLRQSIRGGDAADG